MSKEGLPCSEMRGQRTLYIWDCAKCRRDAAYETEIIRRGGIHRLQRLGRNGLYAPEKTARAYTLSLPFCERCGAAHNERFRDGEAKQYCQPCQDKWTVESYYNNRGIFGNDDVEEIMDRIQKASPDLFKRGVLPDYWFELSLKEKTVE
jgi:ribosomal protein L37AE/L43A